MTARRTPAAAAQVSGAPERGELAVAGLALALAAALVLGAVTAPEVLLVAVALAQGLVIVAWHRSLAVPAAAGGAVVAAAAALAADVLVLADGSGRPLAAVPSVLALAVLAGLVQQLARRDGRDRLNASLTATVSLAALAALGCGYLAADPERHGAELVSAAAVGAALSAGAPLLRRLGWGRPWLELAAGPACAVAAGLVVAAATPLGAAVAVSVCVASAGLAGAAVVLAARTPAPRPVLAAALPVVLAGPVAYVLGRLALG